MRRPHATLRYTDYCLLATQQRCLGLEQVQKQMYKVHQPHSPPAISARSSMKPPPTPTASPTGSCTTRRAPKPAPSMRPSCASLVPTAAASAGRPGRRRPGRPGCDRRTRAPSATPSPCPTARSQPGRPSGRETRHADPGPAALPAHPLAPPRSVHLRSSTDPLEAQAQALVDAFHQRFHGRAPGTAHPKELAHATQLLTEHGAAKAHFLLTYAQQTAPETAYQPKFFGGILPYLPEALAAYDAQARQAAQRRTQQAAAREQRCHERYLTWQQEQCAQLRAALPSTALMALEDAQRARLRAAGTALVALDMAVRVAIDNVLAAQAQLPTFEVWRQQEAAC